MRLTRYETIALIGGAIALSISISVPFLRFAQTPSGRVFAGDQFYSDDYNAYAGTIKQGIDGRWTVVDKFTSEAHQASLFRIFYLVVGKVIGVPTAGLAELARLQPVAVTYHFAQVLLAVALFFVIWKFINTVLPKIPGQLTLITWFLILFANVWPKDIGAIFSLPWRLGLLMPYFREPEVTSRFFSQPHFLAGYIVAFLILTVSIRAINGRWKVGKWLGLILGFGLLGSWIEPTPIVILALAFWIESGLVLLMVYGRGGQGERLKRLILTAGLITLSLVPATVYYQTLRQELPWSNNTIFESQQDFYLGVVELLPVFGLPLILGVVGMVITFFDKKRLINWEVESLLISLVIAYLFLFYPLASLVEINRLRIFRQPVFVIFDIFSAVAIYWMAKRVISIKAEHQALNMVIILMVAVVIIPGIPSAVSYLNNQYLEYAGAPSFAYPLTGEVEAFNWLERHTARSSVVAAAYEAGSLIPQFSGNTSYLGNLVETIDFREKNTLATKFFSGGMSPDEAKKFLGYGRINYIYWGFQEQSLNRNPPAYTFVNKVYTNPLVTIFQVKIPEGTD